MEKQRSFAKKWLLLQLPFFLFVLLYALLYGYTERIGSALFRCRIASELHLYCPGCGGSRAVFALLHGQLLSSLRHYAPVPIAAALLLITDLRMALFLRGKGQPPSRRYSYACMILCIGAVLLQFLLRNLLLFFGIDLLGDILG